MTLTRLVLAVFVVTSSSALAEEPDPAPTWSLGAGLSFGTIGSTEQLGGLGSLGGTNGGLGGLVGLVGFTAPAVTPNVSLERVFSSHFALGLGVEAAVTTLSPFGTTWGSATVGVSPRFTLTPEHSPVAFTVLATVFTGYSSLSVLGPMGTQTFSGGASGGIALEKRFFNRLAVRIQAQLARVTLSRTSSPSQLATGNQTVGSVINASVVPSPSIELRLYL